MYESTTTNRTKKQTLHRTITFSRITELPYSITHQFISRAYYSTSIQTHLRHTEPSYYPSIYPTPKNFNKKTHTRTKHPTETRPSYDVTNLKTTRIIVSITDLYLRTQTRYDESPWRPQTTALFVNDEPCLRIEGFHVQTSEVSLGRPASDVPKCRGAVTTDEHVRDRWRPASGQPFAALCVQQHPQSSVLQYQDGEKVDLVCLCFDLDGL